MAMHNAMALYRAQALDMYALACWSPRRTELDRDRVLQVISSQQQLGSAVASLAPVQAAAAMSRSSSEDQGAQGQLSTGGAAGGGVLQEVAGHVLEAEGQWLWRVSRAWQLGKVSNFDYLMYLNMAAGR
jgi:factor associated with neutral sphingomyelinase activation